MDRSVTRLPTARVAPFVSPCVTLQPSATMAEAPMRSPPEKILTRLELGGSFQLNSPEPQAAMNAPTGTPMSMTMLQFTRLGKPTSG